MVRVRWPHSIKFQCEWMVIADHKYANRRGFRTTPRTPGCTKYDDETMPLKHTSNLTSHMKACDKIPATESYKEWKSRGYTILTTRRDASTMQVDGSGRLVEEQISGPVTQREFRELYVKGLVMDDLPFSFGEKKGMGRVFVRLLPKGVTVPLRNMARRDLDDLHSALVGRVDDSIKVRSAFHSNLRHLAFLITPPAC